MAFELEALGGLRLIGRDGQVVQTQRRRLALLALLAAAGERGLTRDQLVGCLWPDATDDNARHALNQLLYGIRRSLSEDALSGADPLRLDPAVVDSDVRRFEIAMSAGAYADAVAHYRGPFLNGFYLPDAPAFESQVEGQRARLAAAYADALERLAAEAERRGDAGAAVGWRRTLAELDPLDARRATALMRALARAGDSTGAVAHGRTYEALVRGELNAPADPAVVALATEIRVGSARQPMMEATQALTIGAAAPDGPAGPRRTSDAEPLDSVSAQRVLGSRPGRQRQALAYGFGALVLIAALFGARELRDHRDASAAVPATLGPSIAVLPMTSPSDDPRDAALADGMTAELISMLSRVDGLRVIPGTSVFELRGQNVGVRQIAESLRVSHILESGLQKDGSRLRVQIRLTDARDESILWADTYDRGMGDIFAVQDDIGRAVSREIGARLAGRDGMRSPARRYTPSLEAYEWYLLGIDLGLTRSGTGRRQALDYLTRAIAADSSFAAAYAGLARLYVADAGDAPGDQHETYARAERAALRAVALDDSLVEAHVALGWARNVQRDWASAEAEFKRAIALDPRAPRAHEGLARIYLWTGRATEQLAMASVEMEIDPFSHSAIRELALALSTNGRCKEAIERLRPLKALSPPARVAGVVGGQCYAAMQMWPEAIAEFRWAMETGDARAALSFLAYALARGGQRDEAERILSDLLAGRKYSHGAFGIATVYAGLRDFDEAFAWLDKSVTENSVRAYLMGPMFEDLRRDPRFARVKRGIGL